MTALPSLDQLAAQLGIALAEQATLYLPALKRLAWDELMAFVRLLAERNRDEAYALVSAKMTPEELVTEKEALAKLAELRATARAEATAMANAIALAVLRAALTTLLAGAFL